MTFRNIMITINNPSDADLLGFSNEKIQYSIYQMEKGHEEETLHAQGYVEFRSKIRMSGIKKIFPRAHIEKRRGTQKEAIDYCSKSDTQISPPEIFGSPKLQGRPLGTSFENIIDDIDGTDINEFFRKDPINAVMHRSKIESYKDLQKKVEQKDKFLSKYDNVKLRSWQKKVEQILEQQNDREILFVVDFVGNTGKTWLANYLCAKANATYLTNAKSSDIAYSYNNEPLICFDFSRTLEGKINYGIIEQLKNGAVFSSKYKSQVKRFDPPKIVCFMNFNPDMKAFSEDRYVIVNLNPKNKPKKVEQIVSDEFN